MKVSISTTLVKRRMAVDNSLNSSYDHQPLLTYINTSMGREQQLVSFCLVIICRGNAIHSCFRDRQLHLHGKMHCSCFQSI